MYLLTCYSLVNLFLIHSKLLYIFSIIICLQLLIVFKGTVAPSDERVIVALEELQDLKSVWVELSKIWEQIDGQKDQPWLSIQPRKVWYLFLFSALKCNYC